MRRRRRCHPRTVPELEIERAAAALGERLLKLRRRTEAVGEKMMSHVAKATLEIVQWRVLFQDEDSLNTILIPLDEDCDAYDVIAKEQEGSYVGPLTFEYEDPDDEGVTNPVTVVSHSKIRDGETLTSPSGRKFVVTFTEVA